MTQDSVLTAQVLSRVDALANKLAVSSEQLWNIWIETSKVVHLSITVPLFTITILFLLACGHLIKRSEKLGAAGHYQEESEADSQAMFCFFGSLVFAILFLVSLIWTIPHILDPRLHALGQLQELLGR